MSNTSRNVIRKTLSSKFDWNESKKIESSIFNHCQSVYKGFTGKYGSIFTVEEFYKGIAYEKVGQLLTHTNKKEEILTDGVLGDRVGIPIYDLMCRDKVSVSTVVSVSGWTNRIYFDYRENEKKDAMGIEGAMKVMKGEFKCKVKTCRSDECYHFTMQTRSCDEGGTTYVICTKCRGMYTIT